MYGLWLCMKPRESQLTSQSLSIFICEMGTAGEPTS